MFKHPDTLKTGGSDFIQTWLDVWVEWIRVSRGLAAAQRQPHQLCPCPSLGLECFPRGRCPGDASSLQEHLGCYETVENERFYFSQFFFKIKNPPSAGGVVPSHLPFCAPRGHLVLCTGVCRDRREGRPWIAHGKSSKSQKIGIRFSFFVF